jgi:hypothetical protein
MMHKIVPVQTQRGRFSGPFPRFYRQASLTRNSAGEAPLNDPLKCAD